MITENNIVIVFDLDDTLYKEIDFLKSAFKEIATEISYKTKIPSCIIFDNMVVFYKKKADVFVEIIKKYNLTNLTIDKLLQIYRNHTPDITFTENTKNVLNDIKTNVYKVGLITDGRSIQQRNKLKSLNLINYFDDIIISEEFGSEKPTIKNYNYFQDKYGSSTYVYVGDNTQKDFISPNKLGWITICLLDNGKNIHQQNFYLNKESKPLYIIDDLSKILTIL